MFLRVVTTTRTVITTASPTNDRTDHIASISIAEPSENPRGLGFPTLDRASLKLAHQRNTRQGACHLEPFRCRPMIVAPHLLPVRSISRQGSPRHRNRIASAVRSSLGRLPDLLRLIACSCKFQKRSRKGEINMEERRYR
jgi:hypothetical protein